jgi:hypothetical protein
VKGLGIVPGGFPLVQKYTTTAGDLFYFRPRDGQFVLLERRKALAVVVAPEPDIEALFLRRPNHSDPAGRQRAVQQAL